LDDVQQNWLAQRLTFDTSQEGIDSDYFLFLKYIWEGQQERVEKSNNKGKPNQSLIIFIFFCKSLIMCLISVQLFLWSLILKLYLTIFFNNNVLIFFCLYSLYNLFIHIFSSNYGVLTLLNIFREKTCSIYHFIKCLLSF